MAQMARGSCCGGAFEGFKAWPTQWQCGKGYAAECGALPWSLFNYFCGGRKGQGQCSICVWKTTLSKRQSTTWTGFGWNPPRWDISAILWSPLTPSGHNT